MSLGIVAAAVAANALAGAAARATATTKLPHPAPQHRADAYDSAAENTKCEHCHEAISREWRASLHKKAWEDPVFLSAYALEPLSFCRKCHAPEAEPGRAPNPAERAIGIGCVTCHVRDGEVVGSRTIVASNTHHAVVGDTLFSTADVCANCHEFGFPMRPSQPMQRTISEHKTSRHAKETCQSCHMKTVKDAATGASHKSHDFRVTSDPTMLRSAVTATAKRSSGQAILVTLAADRVGHAFPTGDLFRRLEVRAKGLREGAPPIAGRSVILERQFDVQQTPLGTDRVQTGDTRVPASGSPISALILFPEDVGAVDVRWEVAYQRMPPTLALAFGLVPSEDETIVASGTLPITP